MTFDAVGLLLLLLSGVGAGALGALLGIGGGIAIIPILVLGFEVPVHAAVAASLVAVIATSSAAGCVYVGEGLTNMRLAMTLEIATTAGAIAGGLTAAVLSETVLLLVFSAFLLLTAALLFVGREGGERRPASADSDQGGYELRGHLAGGFRSPRTGELVEYRARRVPLGMGASFVAGNVSGLLGVGGGFLKVPAMRLGMGVPMRVAAATSNLMIGVTAAASLVIYVERGYLHPLVAAPVALGVAAGALVGTRLSTRISGASLARLLAFILVAVSVQMLLRAIGVWHG
ncbi:MAG: sulfite exporter TauE/SafE family protein [Actinomycetota bacterium]